MNPLVNNSFQQTNINALPPQLKQGIQQAKSLMKMMNSNPAQLVQQNPLVSQLKQIEQTYRGQNLEGVFMNMCKSRGIDPNAIINELR